MQVQHVTRAIRTGRSANRSWPLVSGDPKSYGTDPGQNAWKFLPQKSEGQKNPGIFCGQESFAAETYENPNLVFSQIQTWYFRNWAMLGAWHFWAEARYECDVHDESNTFGYGARPRRLRDSIVGFMAEHGLIFNADKLRSWISWEVLKLNRCSRQILQQYLSRSIDTCWKKRHDVQPDLGNYGTALTSESDSNIQSSHWHQHASNCLASGDHDRSCMRQPVRTIESLQVQHASRAIGKRHESAWEVWGSKHLWHLLGSRGFGSWNLWKPRLRSYEMLSYAGFSLLLSRRPVRAKCPWGNLILEIPDIKSAPVHRGHWNSHVTKFCFFARRRRCGHQSAIFSRSLRLHHKLHLAPF